MMIGLGQTCTDPATGDAVDCSTPGSISTENPLDISQLPVTSGAVQLPPSYTIATPATSTPAPATSQSWTPAQLATVLGVAGTAAGQSILALNAPRGYVYNPNTGMYQVATGAMVGPGMATTTVGIGGSVIPIIMAVAALGLVVWVLKK